MASNYDKNNITIFSHPNFVTVIDFRQFVPNDPLFNNQWYHQNTGQSGGTNDADIDTPFSWSITRGSPNVIIAVIDNGFDMTHPDLTPNFWSNTGEVPGNGVDDDGNGFIDDVNGFDFRGNDGDPAAGSTDNHGTAVAGTAAASGNNNLGVTGSCPNCSLMLIRNGVTVQNQANAFGYAQQMGAQIITNSWGYSIGTPTTTVVVNAINNAATNGRGGLGSIVLFAMNNPNVNDCGTTPDISSIQNVIGVSRSGNTDRFDLSGFGNCMDVLAPSAGGGTGTLWATTTDRQGTAGYNNNNPSSTCPSIEASPPPNNARDYTDCFNGTSFATPLTAGIAGLILSENPALTRLQVQQLLQDTADKIEDSVGTYATNNGFSSPASGISSHGWGRVNAFEAVRIAAPVANGGLDGTDIFLRDNRLDWGNTEQPSNTLFEPTRGFIGHWRSEDIKVDAFPYQTIPVTSSDFENLVDETPSATPGDINRVYVRVHNRGGVIDPSVTVKLYWSQFGTALPSLPSDFWSVFPADSADTSQWHPLNCKDTSVTSCTITDLGYSGSSVANTAVDGTQIVAFDFPAPAIDPALSNHFCILAMVDSSRDPISTNSKSTRVVDTITPRDNNVSHRNYINLQSRSSDFRESFFVRNPTDNMIQTVLKLDAPQGWKVDMDKYDFNKVFSLAPNQEVLVSIDVALPGINQDGEVSIIQEQIDGQKSVIMGGLVYGFSSPPISEDCLSFNPKTIEVKEINGKWTIVDGSHFIMSFPNKVEADQSLTLIKHYGMNDICFVGRPDPSMTYFLVNGNGPPNTPNNPTGQDCIPFNPKTIEVKEINGKWTIVDGSHFIMSFPNKVEADQSLAIIKHHEFNSTCFVGRPDPSMVYFIPEFPFAMLVFMITVGMVIGSSLLIRKRVNHPLSF